MLHLHNFFYFLFIFFLRLLGPSGEIVEGVFFYGFGLWKMKFLTIP